MSFSFSRHIYPDKTTDESIEKDIVVTFIMHFRLLYNRQKN